uniref:Serine palmitoyltransferase 1 n=1 Tax=Cacopsylla melanoneura TaxID=428564 RepID=A0A8D8VS85_9HEMI
MLVTEQLDFYTGVGLCVPLTLFIVLSLALNKRKKERVNNDDLIDKWTPEPLTGEISQDQHTTSKYVVDQKAGYIITINGAPCINFATHNYLSFVENPEIEKSAIECIQKYGVGSCGPRGFYGTNVVHLALEEDIASFMGLEESALYSFGFTTSASAITAYIKKNDAVFVDENINFAIQTGLIGSRCKVQYFKHNNMEHLEQLLKKQDEKDLTMKKVTKKFIIAEGIYMRSGDICPLKDILELRDKYQARIFLDESLSFGTLGATGCGVTEYFDISTEEIDMIIGSLEYAIGSVGGFCVGSSYIIEHHVLSGAGYCFSASLAPFLAVAANKSLNILKNNPSMLKKLRDNCNLMHELLSQTCMSEHFLLQGHRDTPVKYLYLQETLNKNLDSQSKTLKHISDLCIQSGFAVSCPSSLDKEVNKPRPSIRITCNISHSQQDMNQLVDVLCKSYDIAVKSQS